MDQANPFETPKTFAVHRAEYLVGFAVSTGLIIAHFGEINWWVWIGLFLYIDLIGYIPGAIAFKRSGGRPIPKAYYVLYNVMHSLITQAAVVGLWCWWFGPEWALLAIPWHLSGDRGLFGNFMKSFALPYEPVRQQGYLRLLDDLRLPHPKPVGHVMDPEPVGHLPAVPAQNPPPAPAPVAAANNTERPVSTAAR
ncbi:membrane protein [Streptomyces aureocirculatus]|uniref:membrane protein n=1 Tax=Streptomyces aureocirculatus TaxID=67275 RepID=UPI0004CC851E|nr:membrane protein [Streptomyces aureocirculatus]